MGSSKLINIGFGNIVSASRIIAIVAPESAPIKRIIQEARDRAMLIDATYGRRTRAVIVTDSDHVILSAVQPETVAHRLGCRRRSRRVRMNNTNRGRLLVVSGPSGIGKGTVCKELLRRCSDLLLSISCTTRPMRPGDEEGVTYFFKTEEEFERMVQAGEFWNYAGCE